MSGSRCTGIYWYFLDLEQFGGMIDPKMWSWEWGVIMESKPLTWEGEKMVSESVKTKYECWCQPTIVGKKGRIKDWVKWPVPRWEHFGDSWPLACMQLPFETSDWTGEPMGSHLWGHRVGQNWLALEEEDWSLLWITILFLNRAAYWIIFPGICVALSQKCCISQFFQRLKTGGIF